MIVHSNWIGQKNNKSWGIKIECGHGEVILERTLYSLKPVHPGNSGSYSKLQVSNLIQNAFKFNIVEQALFMPLVRIEVTGIKCFSYRLSWMIFQMVKYWMFYFYQICVSSLKTDLSQKTF